MCLSEQSLRCFCNRYLKLQTSHTQLFSTSSFQVLVRGHSILPAAWNHLGFICFSCTPQTTAHKIFIFYFRTYPEFAHFFPPSGLTPWLAQALSLFPLDHYSPGLQDAQSLPTVDSQHSTWYNPYENQIPIGCTKPPVLLSFFHIKVNVLNSTKPCKCYHLINNYVCHLFSIL